LIWEFADRRSIKIIFAEAKHIEGICETETEGLQGDIILNGKKIKAPIAATTKSPISGLM
jgi:hypothetical protein